MKPGGVHHHRRNRWFPGLLNGGQGAAEPFYLPNVVEDNLDFSADITRPRNQNISAPFLYMIPYCVFVQPGRRVFRQVFALAIQVNETTRNAGYGNQMTE